MRNEQETAPASPPKSHDVIPVSALAPRLGVAVGLAQRSGAKPVYITRQTSRKSGDHPPQPEAVLISFEEHQRLLGLEQELRDVRFRGEVGTRLASSGGGSRSPVVADVDQYFAAALAGRAGCTGSAGSAEAVRR